MVAKDMLVDNTCVFTAVLFEVFTFIQCNGFKNGYKKIKKLKVSLHLWIKAFVRACSPVPASLLSDK